MLRCSEVAVYRCHIFHNTTILTHFVCKKSYFVCRFVEQNAKIMISLQIQCDLPTIPANCYVKSDSLNYRSRIFHKCHKGFAMVSGDNYCTCQSNGSWNGTEPTCAGNVEKQSSEKAVFIKNNVTFLWM